MADKTTSEMKPTLGLTGLTMNAMAAYCARRLSLAHIRGSGGGRQYFACHVDRHPDRPCSLSGHRGLLRRVGKAVSGDPASSYYFAEQSFLNHEKVWKLARLAKFIVGWGSHLYYWIYPGVMVGFMGVLCDTW